VAKAGTRSSGSINQHYNSTLLNGITTPSLYDNFCALKVMPVDAKYGVTYYPSPGKAISCYHFDGAGNLHY